MANEKKRTDGILERFEVMSRALEDDREAEQAVEAEAEERADRDLEAAFHFDFVVRGKGAEGQSPCSNLLFGGKPQEFSDCLECKSQIKFGSSIILHIADNGEYYYYCSSCFYDNRRDYWVETLIDESNDPGRV